MGNPLKRVDTVRHVQLDLPREEGGYPRDTFMAGELPQGRGVLRIVHDGNLVIFWRLDRAPWDGASGQFKADENSAKCVGMAPLSAIAMMHLQSQKDSL